MPDSSPSPSIRNLEDVKRVLETVLLASSGPIPLGELRRVFDEEFNHDFLRRALESLQADWQGRGVELVHVAGGWRFQTRPEYRPYLERLNPEKPPKYSRAVMETLAIIAYRQPVTRGDIEAIRGVAVSSQILKTLEERGWIEVVGHKDVPGRPGLYATTKQFLSDLGLRALAELPPLPELGGDLSAAMALEVDADEPRPAQAVAQTDEQADPSGYNEQETNLRDAVPAREAIVEPDLDPHV